MSTREMPLVDHRRTISLVNTTLWQVIVDAYGKSKLIQFVYGSWIIKSSDATSVRSNSILILPMFFVSEYCEALCGWGKSKFVMPLHIIYCFSSLSLLQKLVTITSTTEYAIWSSNYRPRLFSLILYFIIHLVIYSLYTFAVLYLQN